MYTFSVSVIKKPNMIGISYMYVLHISAWVILHYRSMNEKIMSCSWIFVCVCVCLCVCVCVCVGGGGGGGGNYV